MNSQCVFWIEARPRHPPPHPPPPLSPARSPRVKPEFFLSYLADLSLLLGNLQLHLRIKIPGKFSQTRPQASFARLFFQAVSHERHLIPRQTELNFSAAEKRGPKVQSNVVHERILLFSAPSFQGSWVPG